ncbi:MAG TPA: sigma-70 family RNA polymerase sigma factor [Patescibacteria group bacterium]|nr:sigma-70 family RNA polymerase sigma factor [Patescibacteria group bacterium]
MTSGSNASPAEALISEFEVETIDGVPEHDVPLGSAEEDLPPLTPKQLQFVETYIDLVESIGRKSFSNEDSQELEEVIADGYVGLIKAARKFDPDKIIDDKTELSFVWNTVKGAMFHGMRSRYGRSDKEDGYSRIKRRKPSVILGTAYSLDRPSPNANEDEESTLGDYALPEEVKESLADSTSFNVTIMKCLENHDEREREIFFRYIFLEQSQPEIAEYFGIHQVQVSRLLRRSYKELVAKGIVANPDTPSE